MERVWLGAAQRVLHRDRVAAAARSLLARPAAVERPADLVRAHRTSAYAQFKSAHPPTDPTDAALWGPLPWEAPAASTRDGERLRHAAGDRPAVPARRGQVQSLRAGRTGPLGRSARTSTTRTGPTAPPASAPACRCGAVDPTVESTAVQRARHRAQGGVRDRRLLRPEHARPGTTCRSTTRSTTTTSRPTAAGFRSTTSAGRRRCRPQFDERFYALRRGLGNWVTSPSTRNRRRPVRRPARRRASAGRPSAARSATSTIIDWITLNTDVTLFPNPNRDNFGQVVGLFDYDFRWHVGDRTTIVSDGYFDFFAQAPQVRHGRQVPRIGRRAARSTWASARSKARSSSNVLATSATAIA